MKVRKSSLSSQVRDILVKRIVDGTYPPGERLVELAIARELGVSQAPVREALQALETMRFVESAPHRGTRVREISDRELAESTIVRGTLEEAAAVMGIERLKAEAAELRAEVAAMRTALEANDLPSLAAHAVNFHRAVVEASGNTVLVETWETLAYEARSLLCATKAARSMIQRGIESHDEIINAIITGDGPLVGRLLRESTERCAAMVANPVAQVVAVEA